MNANAFIDICERSFSEAKVKLGPSQRSIYEEKLKAFTEQDLDRIFEKVLEITRSFPKIKDIYDAARELGLLNVEHYNTVKHQWQESECGFCRGEGRICIIWGCRMEERKTGICEVRELTQVFPYSKSFSYHLKPNEYRSIFRCQCAAGDVDTLPKSWPKWTKDSNPRREVWL
jgi:hypothetical protein